MTEKIGASMGKVPCIPLLPAGWKFEWIQQRGEVVVVHPRGGWFVVATFHDGHGLYDRDELGLAVTKSLCESET